MNHIEYMKHRITNYWKHVKEDYNVNGRFIKCKESYDRTRLLVTWEEEGQQYTMVINNYRYFTPEEVFDIWMESDWSVWAD